MPRYEQFHRNWVKQRLAKAIVTMRLRGLNIHPHTLSNTEFHKRVTEQIRMLRDHTNEDLAITFRRFCRSEDAIVTVFGEEDDFSLRPEVTEPLCPLSTNNNAQELN